ncbi:P-loop containing nucleoside triphosphate hydrolase protein, partial [Rhypophila sp. PSN 637]
MRLLKRDDRNEPSLTDDLPPDKIPRYAILSHTWGPDSDEVTYRDLTEGIGKDKVGYKKIQFCAEQAKRDDLEYFWVDTCCIKKSDPTEVQRSINSMFRWYRDATRCYVYLSNISAADSKRDGQQPEPLWDSAFRGHRWFTRGWTLQELLAPVSVEFFTQEGQRLGDKLSLAPTIHEITGIPIQALLDNRLSQYNVEERFKWAEKRETTYEEDWAYCLLGIFGVFMLPNYGEGKDYAVRRLRKEIDEVSGSEQSESRSNPSIMIPFSRDEDFVERQALLDQMSRNGVKPGSRTALVGLGGVGKSQLAIEYGYRIRDQSPASWVFWVHASNGARFEQSFREIAAFVKIPGRHDPKANIFQLVHDWLGDGRNGRWMLILDNLDDAGFLTASCIGGDKHPADKDGTYTQPLIWCLPQCQNGSILVTSRSNEAASELVEDRHIIAVNPMDKEDALALLQKKLRQCEVGDSMDELVTALECMPLAIVQAAAYISQTWPPCSVQQYLDKFRKSTRKKAGLLSYESGKLRRDTGAKNSILITWQISFDHIYKIRPSAVHILSLMSFCDRQGIPASLLQCQDGEIKSGQEQNERPIQGNIEDGDNTVFPWDNSDEEGNGEDSDDDEDSSDDGENIGFRDDIMTLRNFSFISTNGDGKTFEMHRLVQLATLEWLEAHGQQDHWRNQFLRRLSERLPTGEYRNWIECRALFPHAKSAAAVAPKEEKSLQNWATILYKAAWYTWSMGNGAEAEELSRQAMRVRKKVLGREQEETLDAIAMVALALNLRGRWEEAEKLFVQVMETRK